MTNTTGTSTAIDFAALWKKHPKGSPHQRLGVLTEVHERARQTLQTFMIDVRTARGATILTRPTSEPTAENLTRKEWRRLFEMLGADQLQVRDALWRLGLSVV